MIYNQLKAWKMYVNYMGNFHYSAKCTGHMDKDMSSDHQSHSLQLLIPPLCVVSFHVTATTTNCSYFFQ